MPHHVRGLVTRQAHVGVPEGTIEEEIGRGGFAGRASHVYRRRAPVGWSRIEGPLRPRAYGVSELGAAGGDWLAARAPFLESDVLRVAFARLRGAMAYAFRNADADEVLFVHGGRGVMECDYGALSFEAGHYLVVPRGTTDRLRSDDQASFLVIESASEIGLPDRGLLGRHALFDPDVIEVPDPAALPAPGPAREHELRVRRGGEITRIFHPFDPIDVVGWKGDLSVWRLHVDDIRPIASERYHLPPTAHATFVGDGVAICTFLPRPLETGDPAAMKVPFFHANVDYDEVIFYHRGRFFSRQGIAPGMATFHPAGIHHGPQPGAAAAARDLARTDEIAVMIDSRAPLRPTPAAQAVERADYWESWKEGAR
jgi:homogentisate 1,2-dioxygenase